VNSRKISRTAPYRAIISSSVIPVTRLGTVVLLLLYSALRKSSTLSRIVGKGTVSSSDIPMTRLGAVVLLSLYSALRKSSTLSRIVGKGAVSRSLPLSVAMPGRESDRYFTLRNFFFLGVEEASVDA